MKILLIVLILVVVLLLLAAAMSARIVKQYKEGVMFRRGRLQLRNLQSMVEIGVDKNTTVVFPAPSMTTIAELGSFLAGEAAAANPSAPLVTSGATAAPVANGTPVPLAKPH